MFVKELRIASFIGLSHLSKIFVNLFIMRQIAMLHGPEGLGFLGNFMTLIALSATLAGGGILSGIIKYVAEYSGNTTRQTHFISSAFIYTVISAFIVLIIGVLFVSRLTEYIFLNQDFKSYIYFFLMTQVFIAINNFAFGVCNGLRKTETYALIMIAGNIISVVISYFVIPRYGFWGAIIAIASPAFSAFISIVIYVNLIRIPLGKYNKTL